MYKGLKLTVVMATYNGEKFLKQQLDSISKQTLLPDEIIICDDCSTDNTMEIVETFVHNVEGGIEARFYQNEKNMQYTMNFINGVAKSSGDIIFLSDQDDIWDPLKLEKMTEILFANSNILSLSCSYDLIDQEGNMIQSRHSGRQKNNGRIEKINWFNFVKRPAGVPGMSLAIRRELVNKIKTVDKVLAHDWVYNEEAAFLNGLYKYNCVLVHYRQHSNNAVGVIMNSSAEHLLSNRRRILRGYRNIHTFLKKKYEYNPKIECLMEKLLIIDNERLENIENKRMMMDVLLYIKYMNYISFRNFLGDILTILKLIIRDRKKR